MNLYRRDNATFFEVRRLTDAQSTEIEEWINELHRFETDQQGLLIVRANFAELEATITEAKERVSHGIQFGELGIMQLRVQLNRLIGNYLFAFRSFLDQTSHTLSERYGEQSQERQAFISATNVEYDASAAYRFADQLRNHTQHYGFGVDRIGATVSAQPDGTKVGDVRLNFDRDALLRSGFQWKEIVRNDLGNSPAEIDVLPMMTQLNDSISRLAAKRIEVDSPRALDALRALVPLIEEVAADGPGTPMLFSHDLRNTGNVQIKEFPMRTLATILAALKENENP